MLYLPFHKVPFKLLRMECEPVSDLALEDTVHLRSQIDKMKEILGETKGLGLAAPQIGFTNRVFIMRLSYSNGFGCFLNPTLTPHGDAIEDGYESCLSLPPEIAVMISRSEAVNVKYQALNGSWFTFLARGLDARVVQHENDHLNGKLIIDYLSPDSKKAAITLMKKKGYPKFRKKIAENETAPL